jgi:hypothetical protein
MLLMADTPGAVMPFVQAATQGTPRSQGGLLHRGAQRVTDITD